MERLLAKSGAENDARILLVNHTRDVMAAAECLFGTASDRSRLGHCWLRFFQLQPDSWAAFHRNLRAACALHDWGKANDGMQDVLRRKGRQAIRHEHFSALLIGLPEVMKWLEGGGLDVPLVISAVLTHHLKAAFDATKTHGFATALEGAIGFRSLHRHDEFKQLIELLDIGSPDIGKFPPHDRWAFSGAGFDVRRHRDDLKKQVLEPFRNALPKDPVRCQLLHAVRAGLIAADAAGSGLVREGHTVAEWFRKNFESKPPLTGEYIREKVIKRRIDDLNTQFAARNKPPFAWNEFQIACDELPSRALLLAPCGSGKTLAAWRWIAARAAERPVGRVLFLYPTRATAKEGFKDYVSWAPEADAALMHGTAGFDLQKMFDTEDPRYGLSYEANRRLFALSYWPRRIFSATVDQFLAFLQYGYGPVCMLPVLADSVIVVDEVHSFDRNMFSALKEFLRNFDAPVLCMTATLPTDRREQLEGCGLKVYDGKPGELRTIAEMPRYRLTRIGSMDDAFARVQNALASGRRALWVVNTVNRCHEVTTRFAASFDPASAQTELRTADGIPVFCYHSRFKLIDRVDRHKGVVDRMKAGQPAALATTTQVCEMSLDLDVDVLVTEDCPVTSLIQRMGRCNRDREARPLSASGEVLVYPPEKSAPYEPSDLKGLPEFLRMVAGRDLSQVDLENALNNPELPVPDWLGDRLCMFLESGPYAVAPKADEEDANTFREGSDFNRPCVLLPDVAKYLAATADDKPGFLLPVPRGKATAREEDNADHQKLPTYVGVAPDGHYHPAIGFCDRPLTE